MVISNMWPFPTAEQEGTLHHEPSRLRIDIGGPGIVRSGVRNYVRVATVVDPEDYGWLGDRMEELGGKTDLAVRLALAQRAAAVTAEDDRKISEFFQSLDSETVRKSYC